MIFAIIFLIIEIILIWYWLRIIETTAGIIEPNLELKKLSMNDIIFYSLWTIGFIILPVFHKLSEQPDTKNFGLFFTNLIFGKFFWDALLPSFETDNTLKDTIKLFLWGPIANLLSGVLIIKIFSWLLGGFSPYNKTTEEAINFSMNALADMWPPNQSEYFTKIYEFPIGFLAFAFLIFIIRVFTLRLGILPKLFLTSGIFCLLGRCLKYSGNDFNQIVLMSIDSLKQEYSWSNFVAIFLGWVISPILKSRNR